MKRNDLDSKPAERRASPAIVTALITLGIAASVVTGCQTGGATRLSQTASDAPSNLTMRPNLESGRSNDNAPTDAVLSTTKVQTVAFKQAQSEELE